MAHFGVIAPAFYSHFSALSALSLALHARGHRITFLQRPDAAAYLNDERLGFHALGAASHPPGSLAQSLRRAANPGSPLGLRRVIDDMAATTTMLCRELPAAFERLQIDAVLGDQMEAAGGLVAESLGLPFVSVACALPVNREAGIPLPVMPFDYAVGERALHMFEGSTRVYDWMMSPHRRAIEAETRRLGIPVRGALYECLSPLAQVSQTVAAFDFPRTQLPPAFTTSAPCAPPRTRPRPGSRPCPRSTRTALSSSPRSARCRAIASTCSSVSPGPAASSTPSSWSRIAAASMRAGRRHWKSAALPGCAPLRRRKRRLRAPMPSSRTPA